MFEKMKRKIKGATAFIIGVYIVLFLLLASPSWWIELISVLPTWAETIKYVFPLVLGGIAYYFVILDTHNWFDNKFFKERKKVDDYIRTQLTTPCREISCGRANRGVLQDEEQQLMNLFYNFIPKDDTERERAFSYWGEYFITVNLSVYSVLGSIGALIVVGSNIQRAMHPAFFIILLFVLLFNLARIRSKRKLLYPAQAQTARILSVNLDQLEKMLPTYRTQCEECPLTA